MTSRLVALFAALVLLWSGLFAAGPAHAAWAGDVASLAAAPGAPEPHDDEAPVGALHAVADLPAESPADPPALPAHGMRAPDAGFAMAPPLADALQAPPSPDLAGPQRPPCLGSSFA